MPDACPNPLRVYDTQAVSWYTVPCRSRRCGVCGPQRWRPLKLATLHAGLTGDPEQYLVILLTAPSGIEADRFNAGAARRWHHWMTLLRQAFPGRDVQFWRVAELQQRGHVHYHVVLRGLVFLSVDTLRRTALQAGFGFWVGVRKPRSYPQGLRGLGGYLGKYLLKDAGRRLPNRARMVTMSHGWLLIWENRRRERRGVAQPGRFVVSIGRVGPWRSWPTWTPPPRPKRLLGEQLVLPGLATGVKRLYPADLCSGASPGG